MTDFHVLVCFGLWGSSGGLSSSSKRAAQLLLSLQGNDNSWSSGLVMALVVVAVVAVGA